MAEDVNEQDPAPVAEPEPEPPKQKARKAADPADALAGVDEDTEAPADGPPRVWLQYNPKSGRVFGHVPTEGSGPGGEFSPDEVAHHFPTRAQYDAATKAPDGQEPMYLRVKKPAGQRDPAAWWKSTNPDAYGTEGDNGKS